MTDVQLLPLAALENNKGQIAGVPKNPRIIRNEQYKRLVSSLQESDLTDLKPLLVYPTGKGKYVVLGGNMRLRALRELKVPRVSCIVIPTDTDVQVLKKAVIIDNNEFGEYDWDAVANEWSDEPLADWGVDLPVIKETEKLSKLEYKPIYYEPEEIPNLTLSDCMDEEKYNAKIEIIERSALDENIKEELKKLAYRFIRIDFGKIADYYAFNASEEEKEILERLRVVLVDNGIEGFIEDDLLKIKETFTNWEEENDEN